MCQHTHTSTHMYERWLKEGECVCGGGGFLRNIVLRAGQCLTGGLVDQKHRLTERTRSDTRCRDLLS